MDLCIKYRNNGMILRSIVTIILFYLLANYSKKSAFIVEYLYFILPIILTILDEVDNVWTIQYKQNICTKTFNYQIKDKIFDSLSYLVLYLFFDLDNILLAFILYRIIGIYLFYITRKSFWLILFFDFAKEYLLYLFIFNTDYYYISIFILCKIAFEYYFHTKHNIKDYNL